MVRNHKGSLKNKTYGQFLDVQPVRKKRFSHGNLKSKRYRKDHKDHEIKEDDESEILSYKESELRLILLGVISSIALLTCATAFLAIGSVSYSHFMLLFCFDVLCSDFQFYCAKMSMANFVNSVSNYT